jgi:hypothetical protein
MPFLESYPVRAQGPRTDLSFAYLNATINNATVTVNASETTAGYSISRNSAGNYTITFKKCRFIQITPKFMPTAVALYLIPFVLSGVDPTAGTATMLLTATAAGAVADPTAAAHELEIQFLSGF